jgi:hypothetical protein
MTADEIIKTIEAYKSSRLSQGAVLEDICDEIDDLVGDRLDEWLEG